MDDIIILGESSEKLHYYHRLIEKYLNTILHLSLNDKTCINKVEAGINFVGLRVWSTHKKLRRSTARRIIRSVKKLCINYNYSIITLDELLATLNSYKSILDFCDCYGLNKFLANIYLELGVGLHMQNEAARISESATIIKFNEEDNKMIPENFKWKCKTKLEKYKNDESYNKGTPDEVIDIDGNTALIVGLNLLWKLASGLGDNSNNYFIDSDHAFTGVGNSSANASSSQTGLLGTSKAYKGMDQSTGVTYPLISNNTITFRSKFGANEGNFTWNEWGILNGNPNNLGSRAASTVIQLNRKVESMGTKVAGSTWVIVTEITINP